MHDACARHLVTRRDHRAAFSVPITTDPSHTRLTRSWTPPLTLPFPMAIHTLRYVPCPNLRLATMLSTWPVTMGAK